MSSAFPFTDTDKASEVPLRGAGLGCETELGWVLEGATADEVGDNGTGAMADMETDTFWESDTDVGWEVEITAARDMETSIFSEVGAGVVFKIVTVAVGEMEMGAI